MHAYIHTYIHTYIQTYKHTCNYIHQTYIYIYMPDKITQLTNKPAKLNAANRDADPSSRWWVRLTKLLNLLTKPPH